MWLSTQAKLRYSLEEPEMCRACSRGHRAGGLRACGHIHCNSCFCGHHHKTCSLLSLSQYTLENWVLPSQLVYVCMLGPIGADVIRTEGPFSMNPRNCFSKQALRTKNSESGEGVRSVTALETRCSCQFVKDRSNSQGPPVHASFLGHP